VFRWCYRGVTRCCVGEGGLHVTDGGGELHGGRAHLSNGYGVTGVREKRLWCYRSVLVMTCHRCWW
jgi:hypothetical protein